MVRHERDPYLYFLDISNGLKDFGLKRTEKVFPPSCFPAYCCALLVECLFAYDPGVLVKRICAGRTFCSLLPSVIL
jgi:hypothetical protein